MTFGIIGWLKSQYPELNYEIPVVYPSRDKPDNREWLVTNGLGGFSMGTISGANRRRYHAVLVSAVKPMVNRHLILSRVEEVLRINGRDYELSTNHWESGVVSPTGYKFMESFTPLPCPTWVFEFDGNYLVKQLVHPWGTDQVHMGYHWIPEDDSARNDVKLTCKFLVGFRDMHGELHGSADKTYAQFVSPNQSVIILDENSRLCLTWGDGKYESQKQWWWDFDWPIESIRGLPNTEDLYFVGSVSAKLQADKSFCLGASYEKPLQAPDCSVALKEVVARQKELIDRSNLDNSQRADMMLLACDQFLVTAKNDEPMKSVIEGYPWYNSGGRAAMLALPGLTVSTRRFDAAKDIFRAQVSGIKNGIMPNWVLDLKSGETEPRFDYEAADVTLWWGWALYKYYRVTQDKELVAEQLPAMISAIDHFVNGTNPGISVDPEDGLLRCADKDKAFTWMGTKVEGMPITPRSGKAVELCALWYSFLETVAFFAEPVMHDDATRVRKLAEQAKNSMSKFWNEERSCLFDIIDTGVPQSKRKDDSVRCNQLLAVSLPYRAFTVEQEKAILRVVEEELLTPMGVRTLSPSDPSYQGVFGCGLAHPDPYHRDLSRHQGTAYPWLIGQYCDALVNVFGPMPETVNRIRLLWQPIFDHISSEDCLNSISEMFDGNRPQLPRGCPASATAVAEAMRWLRWVIKQ
ncbi:glycogen debranching enzyme family protein [Candidatus Obscuribacterales bacterium]|nr:glycogen debranching enzyme family protein [Candidatus Obscuribacterales bacterium]MBX3152761.1 glycogen debranching enzyme family protein [Candidatus Obscuribacterales bacterium]